MNVPDLPLGLWSLWPVLPKLERLFLHILLITTLYCLWSGGVTLARLRSLATRESKKDIGLVVVALSARSRNVRQAIGATLYLFWIILFLCLESIKTLDDTRLAAEWTILQGFALQFAFAANVLLVLFVLYVVQWLVSARFSSFRDIQLFDSPRSEG